MVTVLPIWLLAASAASATTAITHETPRVPMRDGVKLAANVFRPQIAGKLPTILIRTPYNKGKELARGHRTFVEQGYVIMVQDVRGRYESEGVFDPLHQEPRDGDDTL